VTRRMTRAQIVSLVALLTKRPCTARDLQRHLNISRTTANDWLRELRKQGCVRVAGYSYQRANGFRSPMYEWGKGPDELKPAPMTAAQRVAKMRDKSRIDRAWRI